jgi:tyrosine aminotransferase
LEYDKWKDINDTFAFAQKLIDEENVLCLPGECFFKPAFIRIGNFNPRGAFFLTVVISHPADILKEACDRMIKFCERHAK